MSDNSNLLRVATMLPMDPRHRQLLLDSADEIDQLHSFLKLSRLNGDWDDHPDQGEVDAFLAANCKEPS